MLELARTKAAEVLLLVIVCWAYYYWIVQGLPGLLFALRSGIFRSRGRVYLRSMSPGHFWGGVFFLAFGLFLMTFTMFVLLLGLLGLV